VVCFEFCTGLRQRSSSPHRGVLSTIAAYPSGGRDYEVAHKNLGEKAGLVVALALLVDYVLTVVVSVASGVDNIISAIPELNPFRVGIAIFFVVVLTTMNLRGVRESSKAFAIPTYIFRQRVLYNRNRLIRTAFGDPPSRICHYGIAESLGSCCHLLLLGISGGCVPTGVEAISNGVPAFQRRSKCPEKPVMGGIAIVLLPADRSLFLRCTTPRMPAMIGFTDCATQPQRSLVAQVASSVFGNNSIMFFVIQAQLRLCS
jgi:hypothetical protein